MNPSVTIIVPQNTMRLSESQEITLTFEAVSPVTLTVPSPVLSETSRQNWHIRTISTPTIKNLKPGLERWQQVYRVEPFAAGTHPLEFSPFEINGVTVAVPGKTITIQTAVDAETELRPVTATLPVSNTPSLTTDWLPDLVATASLIAIALLFRRRSVTPPPTPEELAQREFHTLETETDASRFATTLSKTIRTLLERRDGVPVTRLATSEICDPAVRTLLARCDDVKFAGQTITDEERKELLIEARRITGV